MPSTTATTPRVRRVRCAGCTELFTRDQLTDGQCATCASIVEMVDEQGNTFLMRPDTSWSAETMAEHGVVADSLETRMNAAMVELADGYTPDDEAAPAQAEWVLVATTEAAPALVERRCAGCAEWFPADQLADFRCGGCAAQSAPEAIAAIVLADEQVPQQDDTAVMNSEPVLTDGDSGALGTPVLVAQPAAPAQVSKLWTVTRRSAQNLVDWVGPRESFDEAQRRASQLAKASKRETGVRPHWLSVHEWLLGNGEQLLLVRVEA